MKRSIYLLIPAVLLGTVVTACGNQSQPFVQNTPTVSSTSPDESTGKQPDSTNVISNNSKDMPNLKANEYDQTHVSINPQSPYQDYAVVLAHYLSMKLDASTIKHITIQSVILDAKPQDQNKPTGQATIIVEHQAGKSSAYQEGKNLRFVQFAYQADGSITLESIATSPIVNGAPENPAGKNVPPANSNQSSVRPPALDLPQGIINTINPIGKQYNMKNAWQKVIGNRFVQVYAGAFVDDSRQGVVVVHDNALDLSKVNIKEFKTATKHGSVKVEAESKNVLVLRADDGTTYLFDADKLEFVALQD